MATSVVHTVRFGDVRIDDDERIEFVEGLVGFEHLQELVLLPVDEDGLFSWLQSTTHPEEAFLVLTPWPLFPDYEPELPALDQVALDLEDAGDALVFCVVTSHDEPRRFTANLAGPVIVNQRNRQGRQVVLEAGFPTRAELPSV